MFFTLPYILFALLFAPVLAWLYLRRTGKREQVVPSLILWRRLAESTAEQGRKSGAFNWPLVFALLAFCLLIIAAAGPAVRVARMGGGYAFVIVDVSASMAAKTNDGKSRLERGIADVSALLDKFSCVRVICLPEQAGFVQWNLTASEARRELASLRPTGLPLDMRRAIAALAPLAEQANEIILITDDPTQAPPELAGKPIRVIAHSEAARNIALETFDVSRTGASLVCFAVIRNYTSAPADVPVELKVDGVVKEQAKLSVAAESTASFTSKPFDGNQVTLTLAVADNFTMDNSASAIRSGKERVRVAYVGEENPFVLRALAILPGVETTQFKLASDPSAGYDAYIYDGVAPQQLPAGLSVLIDPPHEAGPFKPAGNVRLENPTRVAQVNASPLMSADESSGVDVTRLTRLAPNDAVKILFAAEGGVLLAESQDAKTRAFFIGTSLRLNETNWPMSASFPIFWSRLISMLEGTTDTPVWFQTGEQIPAAYGAAPVSLRGPNGEAATVNCGLFTAITPGIYRDDRINKSYAINVLHRGESYQAGMTYPPKPQPSDVMLAGSAVSVIYLERLFGVAGLFSLFIFWLTARKAV